MAAGEQIDWGRELRTLYRRSQEEHTWVTGKLELILRSGESIAGELRGLESHDQIAVMKVVDGQRRVEVSEIANAIVEMSSPVPE